MTPLFKKLNFKNQAQIICINGPESFEQSLLAMQDITIIKKDLKKIKQVEFAMAFVITQADLDNAVKSIAPLLSPDGLLWMCYPKMSSKKYTSTINRDNGWQIMGSYNLEPVRGVAIDDDWSALRFRNVDFIKTMDRKFGALSDKGKVRISVNKK
jgi:hypothetical protein